MTLKGLQARHARQILGSSRGTAETVTYRFQSGDPDRTVSAVVRRLFLEPSSPQARPVRKRRCDVELARDDTVGVSVYQPGDSIVLPVGIGEAAVECRITRVVAQDDARIVLQVTE